MSSQDEVSELREQLRFNETLLRIATSLGAELDLDSVMQKLTDEATALCRAQFGAFFYNVTNEQGESYMLYTLSGLPRSAFAHFPMPRNTAIFAPTFAGEGVVRIDDVLADPRYGKSAPYHGMPPGHPPVRAYLALPVKARDGQTLGGLFFGHATPGTFTERDERLIVSVAAVAATAIANAQLYKSARAAEKRAAMERERLQLLFTRAPAAITITRGPDHVYELVNPVAEQLFGATNVVGKPYREAIANPSAASLERLDHVYRTGERFFGAEVPTMRDWNGDGRPHERHFNFVLEPYCSVAGAIDGVMSFAFEVTDQVLARRRLEAVVEQLEIASRTKDEFLANVSHELRTPLNAILGWIRMLRTGSVPEERRERAISTIERNANAQAQLVEDLLDVSRIISGKLRLSVSPIDLASVIESAVETVRPAANAKGVTLRTESDADVGPILGDSDRVRQIVWNLLSNAVKFTPRGGHVRVGVRARDTFVEISVADDGQGIEPEFLPYAFERFRQADATPTRTHGGLGLGLAIVRHLVELHGGTVRVESAGAGKGATFTVVLPVSAVRAPRTEREPTRERASSPQSALPCPAELKHMHVLVVDDEPDARELIVEVLRPCGARVSTASSSSEALCLVEESSPDLIVSDIGMPGEDGWTFVEKLRALPPERGGRTPAVALTAYARVEDRTRALVAGFNMHVPKPVDPGELLVVLASLSKLADRR